MSVESIDERAAHVAARMGMGEVQSWPTPRPISADLLPAPAFDAEVLLPPRLREFVLDEADRMPCPPDYIAAALIVSLGSVIGARCALKPKSCDASWIVPPNLWGGVVGEPASKKTPALQTIMKLVDRLEVLSGEALERMLVDYQAEFAAYNAQKSAIEAAMKKAANGSTGRSMGDLVTELALLKPPEEPTSRRFKVADSTTARLADLLSVNPAGLMVFRDELTGLLSSWDRPGNEQDRAFYLEAHNGIGNFRQERVTRGDVFIENHCLSLFGGIQPDLLGKYLNGVANSMDNDGRIQRFQVLVYPDPVPWEWRNRYPVHGARELVRDLFQHLSAFDPVAAGAAPATDTVKLPFFHYDEVAQGLYIEWSTDLYCERIPKESVALMRQHLSKYERLFNSIALILHCCEDHPGPSVGLETATRAAAWCQYLEGHARRIYGLLDVQQVSTASTLSRKLHRLPRGFTVREVHRRGWRGLHTVAAVEQALAVLEDHGHVVGVEYQHPKGGPLTLRYYQNPRLDGAVK